MSYKATDWPARSQYYGPSDSFLLNCGGIESVVWDTPKLSDLKQHMVVYFFATDRLDYTWSKRTHRM